MSKKRTKKEAQDAAKEVIQFFSAALSIDDNPIAKRGKLNHLDPSAPPTEGWWVDCKVFVPEDYGKDD